MRRGKNNQREGVESVSDVIVALILESVRIYTRKAHKLVWKIPLNDRNG